MPKPLETGPTPSLLEKIQNWFGYGPLPENIKQGINLAQKQGIPTENVQQMGPIGRFFGSAATAVATPGKNINMNVPGMVGQTPQDVSAIIAHENEHINQMKNRGGNPLSELWYRYGGNVRGLPYGQRPDELGAYQVEKKQRLANKEAGVSIPSFSNPGQWINVNDVTLPLSGSPSVEAAAYKKRIGTNAGVDTGPTSTQLQRVVRK